MITHLAANHVGFSDDDQFWYIYHIYTWKHSWAFIVRKIETSVTGYCVNVGITPVLNSFWFGVSLMIYPRHYDSVWRVCIVSRHICISLEIHMLYDGNIFTPGATSICQSIIVLSACNDKLLLYKIYTGYCVNVGITPVLNSFWFGVSLMIYPRHYDSVWRVCIVSRHICISLEIHMLYDGNIFTPGATSICQSIIVLSACNDKLLLYKIYRSVVFLLYRYCLNV